MNSGRAVLLELLARARVFSGLGEKTLADVLAVAHEHRLEAGEVPFREGEPPGSFAVVVSGRLKPTQVGPDGHEVILRFVGPGEAAAALAAFEETAYPATAWAVGDTLVLEWPRDALQELLRRHPALALNLLRLLSERLRDVQERFRELATERVAQRIARALVRLVRKAGRREEFGVVIDMPLSRQDLAEMTGTYRQPRALTVGGTGDRRREPRADRDPTPPRTHRHRRKPAALAPGFRPPLNAARLFALAQRRPAGRPVP